MHELAPIIKDLAIVLLVAGLVTLLFQRIRQPVVLGYLVAGLIIGPYSPPHALVNDIPNIQILADLGVIFLMFSLGLDFSFHKLTKVGFAVGMIGSIEVILMLLVGFGAGRALGWGFYDSIFLGAALSISSTTIIIKALEELNLRTRRFADLIIGVLIVEDLLAILILVALSLAVTTKQLFSYQIIWAGAKLLLVVGSWFLIGYFCIPLLMRRVSRYISNETLTIVSVGLCLVLVMIAAAFHYSLALGAFIMGSILAETPQAHRIETLVRPIRDIFAAVFFVSVGMLMNPMVIIDHWGLVLVITAVTVFGKILITGIGALFTGQGLNTSVRLGFGMAQVGEFSFIIIGLGVSMHAVNDTIYPVIVAVSAITTFTTPFLINVSGRAAIALEKSLPSSVKYFLESYSTWVYRSMAGAESKAMFRKAVMRFLVNALIIAILFTVFEQLLLPILKLHLDYIWMAKALGWLMVMLLASPSVWAMLFVFKFASIKRSTFNPAMILAWVLTFYEISFLSLAFFDSWETTVALLVIAALGFVVLYRYLERSYHWFEKRLISNLGQAESESLGHQLKQLAPWHTHLVEVNIGPNSQLIGKSLRELQLRQRYNINVIAIERGHHTILVPAAKEVFYPHDKLAIIGSDDEIDTFREIAEQTDSECFGVDLASLRLKPISLNDEHPLIGQSIRDSNLRGQLGGLVVGLERQGKRILNPDSSTVLEQHDLLLVAGYDQPLLI
ncbi:MAG: cation:proton antiporter [Gammaproteobacteria bacterium]|nr:cation:proton antiporter [Gammaproteobacteria bacterium]